MVMVRLNLIGIGQRTAGAHEDQQCIYQHRTSGDSNALVVPTEALHVLPTLSILCRYRLTLACKSLYTNLHMLSTTLAHECYNFDIPLLEPFGLIPSIDHKTALFHDRKSHSAALRT
jgi:hypothetical protein